MKGGKKMLVVIPFSNGNSATIDHAIQLAKDHGLCRNSLQ